MKNSEYKWALKYKSTSQIVTISSKFVSYSVTHDKGFCVQKKKRSVCTENNHAKRQQEGGSASQGAKP